MISPFKKLSSIGTKISFHIQLGGTIEDEVGNYLVNLFINEFLEIPKKYQPRNNIEEEELKWIGLLQTNDLDILTQKENNGEIVSPSDLELILKESIKSLMPNIWIRNGGPMVAGTLMFLEPIGSFGICLIHGIPDTDNQIRIDFLKMWATKKSIEIKTKFEQQNNSINVNIKSAGSGLPMKNAQKDLSFPIMKLIFLIILISLIGYMILK